MDNPYNIQEIRILPMTKKENVGFRSEAEARYFLAVELIQEDGKYGYEKRGIVVERSPALVLFQYDASIIGYGILEYDEKSRKYLQFLAMTVHNISKITLDELQKIEGKISVLSNSKQYIEIRHFKKIYRLLLRKQAEFEQAFF